MMAFIRSIVFIMMSVLLVTGCQGPEGPMGPAGPMGPEGPEGPGVTMIKEYTGIISSNGDFSIDVPEIKGKRDNTFVMAYWAFPVAPDIWIPMSDGWLDDENLCHIFSVSWNYGKVAFLGMQQDDLYLLQVFEHN